MNYLKIFEYPDSSYKQSIVDIADNIKEKYPLASKELMELHSKFQMIYISFKSYIQNHLRFKL